MVPRGCGGCVVCQLWIGLLTVDWYVTWLCSNPPLNPLYILLLLITPQGHVVVTSPSFAHRLEYIYKNANDFDPGRYGPGREEDKKVQFAYIGFGGGRHSCMGYNFAYLQVCVNGGCVGCVGV